MKSKKNFKESLSIFGRSLTIGGTSAAIGKTLVAPIERVKIILQVQANHPDISPDKKFKGIYDCFIKLYKQQPKNRIFLHKILTYWRGNGVNIIRYFPMQAINFATKGQYKKLLEGRFTEGFKGDLMKNLISGGAAGGTSITFVYPIDLSRTRLASDVGVGRKYKGLLDCLVKTFKNEGGIRGVYKGYVVSICGIIPYRAVYFTSYDMCKKYLMNDKPEDFSFWKKWAIAQSSSVLSQFTTYPHDTVRRRMQIVGTGSTAKYINARHCFIRILKDEGIAAFYKGCMCNIVRATGCALSLVFYDSIGRFLFLDKEYGGH